MRSQFEIEEIALDPNGNKVEVVDILERENRDNIIEYFNKESGEYGLTYEACMQKHCEE